MMYVNDLFHLWPQSKGGIFNYTKKFYPAYENLQINMPSHSKIKI